MVKCGVLFEVRTELLYNISTNSGFKGLMIYVEKIFRNYTLYTMVPVSDKLFHISVVFVNK
jgi:hypothetical protein